jgi:hypothetical protein
MKVIAKLALLLVVAGLLTGAANGQSLGEAARQARKKKSAPSPAQKVYTNENLPTNAPISVMSGSGVSGSSSSDDKDNKGDATAKAASAQGAGAGDQKKAQDEWQARFAEQKNKIQLLEREIDVIERERQVQVSVFYADAGARLRDDRKWADQERKYKSDLESRQKQLADAKQRLEDMQEEARKAGLPASMRE